MLFKIRGATYNITTESIISAAKGMPPNPPNGMNKYYVGMEGGKYPIKQLISLDIGIPNIGFHAQDAHRILTKLDFEIEEFAVAVQPQPRPVQDNGESFAFPITIEQDEDEFWLASCPSLPGCHSQAHSKPEAIVNIKEAIRGYLASMHAHGETIPDQEWVIVEVAI